MNAIRNTALLEIFSDYIWPWCYFITGRVEKLKTAFDIDIQWTAFPLHPETPKEGMTLEELFAGRPINIKQVMDHLSSVAAELGLPFGKREKTFNSRIAQELGKLAEKKGYRLVGANDLGFNFIFVKNNKRFGAFRFKKRLWPI